MDSCRSPPVGRAAQDCLLEPFGEIVGPGTLGVSTAALIPTPCPDSLDLFGGPPVRQVPAAGTHRRNPLAVLAHLPAESDLDLLAGPAGRPHAFTQAAASVGYELHALLAVAAKP